MTELERLALLGDKQAQKECTEKGIVLPCPFCGGEAKLKKGFPSRQIAHCRQAVVQCKKCGNRTVTYKQLPMERWEDVDKSALEAWNTRPAPPVGRCGECKNVCDVGDNIVTCDIFERDMMPDDFCSQFEPKDSEVNENRR